jgi:cob(I)alamin adenosyltransferase
MQKDSDQTYILRQMKIYTKTGDKGDTGLFGGGRVPKNHLRVEAYGDVDEVNSFLGMARSIEAVPRIDDILLPIQRDLFAIGALLATPDRDKMREHLEKARIDDDRIAELERAIDDADGELEPLRSFIVPGGSLKAASLHVARTVCRRAERRVVKLTRLENVLIAHDAPKAKARDGVENAEIPAIPAIVVIYLNRLSDLLFTLARLANARAGVSEVTW